MQYFTFCHCNPYVFPNLQNLKHTTEQNVWILRRKKKDRAWFYGALLFVTFNKMGTEMNIYDRKLQTVMPSHTPCRALWVTGA